MSLLPPRLMQRLGRTRFNPLWVEASSGIGERRSRTLGGGMEFEDHRRYQHGDDLRHIDRHVYARLRQHHVRQYAAEQQLPITVLLDASASMGFGTPSKFAAASALAAAIAYIGAVGGDQVQVGVFEGGRVRWHPRFQGSRRIGALIDWLGHVRPAGTTGLAPAADIALVRVNRTGLAFLVSDFMVDGVPAALETLARASQELVAVQVLAPEELEPERLGAGEARFVDAESGFEVECALDAAQFARYRDELAAWLAELREEVRSRRGRLLLVRSDDDIERIVARDWRREGLIR